MNIALSLASLLIPGHAIVSLIARRTPVYWFERWAMAFLLGTAGMSALWLLMSPLYDVIQPVWLLSFVSTAVAAAAWGFSRVRLRKKGDGNLFARQASKRFPSPFFGPSEQRHPIDWLLCAAIAVELIVITFAAMRTPLEWDGLFNFEIKARLIFENHPSGRLPLDYLSDTTRNWSHPQYPLMVPFAEFWIYAWLGRIDQTAVKILFPLFYVCLAALLCGGVRRASSVRIALLATAAVGLMPPMTLLHGAVSGYADVPLAAAVIGFVSFAFLAFRDINREAAMLAGGLAAVAVWTKAEGVVLVLAPCAAVIVWQWWKTRREPNASVWYLFPLVGIPLAAAIPWWVVQKLYGIASADFTLPAAGWFSNAGNVPRIAGIVAAELLRPGHWGLLWPAFALTIGLLIVGRHRGPAEWFLAASVAFPLMVYVAVFTFSAWDDPLEHARLAVPRLVVPLAPGALMFTLVSLVSPSRIHTP